MSGAATECAVLSDRTSSILLDVNESALHTGSQAEGGDKETRGAPIRADKENRPEARAGKTASLWETLREVDTLKEQLAHEQKLRQQAEVQARTAKRSSTQGGANEHWSSMREVDALKEQLAHETLLREQAEVQAGMGRYAKRSATDANEQLLAANHEISSLQEQCDILSSALEKSMERENDVKPDMDAKGCGVRTAVQNEVGRQVNELHRHLEDVKLRTLDINGELQKLKPCSCKKQWLELRDLAQARMCASKVVQDVVVRGVMNCIAFEQEMCSSLSTEVGSLTDALDKAQQETQGQCELSNALRQAVLLAREESAIMKADQAKITLKLKDEIAQLTAKLICVEKANTESLAKKDVEICVFEHRLEERVHELQEARGVAASLQEDNVVLQSRLYEQGELLVCAEEGAAASLAKDARMCFLEQRLDEQSMELQRASEDVAGLKEENLTLHATLETIESEDHTELVQELRQRTQELLKSVEHFTHECHRLEAENQSLGETVKDFEDSLSKHKMGHVNHKQKIEHTIMLKKENLKMREEVNKLRRKTLSLEADKNWKLLEALPALKNSLLQGGASQQRTSVSSTDTSSTLNSVRIANNMVSTSSGSVKARPFLKAEVVLQGVIQDFIHVQTLIERAISGYDSCLTESLDFEGLLDRLRRVVADRRSHDKVTKPASERSPGKGKGSPVPERSPRVKASLSSL